VICISVLIACFCYPAVTAAQTDPNGQWIAFNRAGAPNSNLQCFTPSNVSVSDGYLIITTKSETASCNSVDLPYTTHNYTSGFVAMRSFNFLYGTLEVRAKFGGGTGTGAWPAVWMADASCEASDPTGTDDHCNQQEIDVAEILDSDFTHVHHLIHVEQFAHNDGCAASTTDASQNFHIYQLVWAPGSLVFKIDGIVTCTVSQTYVPSSPMYVKIDMFVGNNGGFLRRALRKRSLPWTTVVDYVKVTQGSTVVFNDDFSSGATVQPAEFVLVAPAPRNASISAFEILLHWSLRIVIVCVLAVIVIAAVTFRRRLMRNREKIS
jgi:beta-glucanase (GH16 family)